MTNDDTDITALVLRLIEDQAAGRDVLLDALCREHPARAAEISSCYRQLEDMRAGLLGGRGVGNPSSAWDSNPAVRRLRARSHPYERYANELEIGRGGMGVITRAYDTDLDRELAVKRVRADQVSDRALERFFDEARVTARLDHPGIIPVYELGLDSRGDAYFSMQLVRGERFADVLDRHRGGEPTWPLVRVLNTVLRAAEAVAYAHDKRIIHRDLKPANIMVGAHGQVYVVDWGLARELDGEERRDLRMDEQPAAGESPLRTRDGDVVGTVAYMPPEQGRGDIGAMGAWSDVYSLGAILYELLTGRVPYRDGAETADALTLLARLQTGPPLPVGELAAQQPAELVAICDKAMARDPKRRYPNAGALAADLQAYLDGRVVTAHRTGVWVELRKWIARNRALAIVSCLAISATLVGGALSAWFAIESTRNERRGREALAQFVTTLGYGDPAFSDDAAKLTLADALRRSIDSNSNFDPAFPDVEGMIRQARGIALARLQQLDVSLTEMRRALPLQRRALGPRDPTYHNLLNWLAEVHIERRELAPAKTYIDEALGLCPDVPPQQETELTLHTKYLDVMLATSRDDEDAHERAQALLGVAQQALESNHQGVILGMIEVGISIMYNAKQPEMGRLLLMPAYEKARAVLGEDHPYTLHAMRELCYFDKWDGDVAEAEAERQRLYEKSLAGHRRHLALCEQRLGPQHPDTILSLRDVADMYNVLGRILESEVTFDEAMVRIGRSEYPRNFKFLLVHRGYAELLAATDRPAEAKRRLLLLYDEARDMVGWSHLSTIAIVADLIDVSKRLGHTDDVAKWKQEHERARKDYNSRISESPR